MRWYPEDFVEFLAGKGDYPQAAAGIGKLFPGREPVWREANLALLGEASGGAVSWTPRIAASCGWFRWASCCGPGPTRPSS